MSSYQRWYDKVAAVSEMFSVLKVMPDKELDKIAGVLFRVVNEYCKDKRSQTDECSIGKNKLFNYYKGYQNRRWYDENPTLKSAANLMSTIEEKEMENIVNTFLRRLQQENLRDIYDFRKMQLKNGNN